MPLPFRRRRARRPSPAPPLLAVGLALAASGCGDSAAGPANRVFAGVDFDVLFAPPTPAEIAAVEAEWAGRTVEVVEVSEALAEPFDLGGSPGTLRVLAHRVGGSIHYGMVIAPDGAPAGTLPVLVYAHGGDQGVRAEDVALAVDALGALADGFVYVVPSYRSEPLSAGGTTFVSGGEASPWDGDVDDALAFLEVALGETPAADPGRIVGLGFSRGSTVLLLMGIRDARIDGVVEFFGPTDFFDIWAQQIAAEALVGAPRGMVGFDVLERELLYPLAAGEIGIPEARQGLLRRSPVHFAARLPRVQLHHGTADPVVSVTQGISLALALDALDRTAPPDEAHFYEGGVHHPTTLAGSAARTTSYLSRF